MTPKWRKQWPIEKAQSGLYSYASKLDVKDMKFEDYTNGWGFVDYYSDLTMQNVSVIKNSYGMRTYAPVKFAAKNCKFDNNRYWGFQLYNHRQDAKAKMSRCSMSNNAYGAYFYRVSKDNLALRDTTIANNRSHGLYMNDCDAEFSPRTMGTRWKLSNNGYNITAYYGKTKFDSITMSDAKSWAALTYYGDVKVRNCNFTKNGSGFYSYYNKSFDAVNSHFDQNSSYGLAYASDGKYYGYKREKWGWHAADGPGRIANCSINNNLAYGLHLNSVTPNTLRMSDTPIQGNRVAGLYAYRSRLLFNQKTMRDTWQLKDNGSHIFASYGQYSFDGLSFSDAKSIGVYTWYSDVRVKDCKFERNGSTGFQSYYDKSFKAEDSTFARNGWSGINYYSNGTYYGNRNGKWGWHRADGPGQLKDCLVEKNTSYGMYLYGVKDNGLRVSETPIRGHASAGLYANRCDLAFTPRTMDNKWLLSDNGTHIYAAYGKYRFDSVSLSDARSRGVYSWYSDIAIKDCSFDRNGSVGYTSYYDKTFRANTATFSNNKSWGLQYYSNGTHYGIQDGKWGWYDNEEPGQLVDCTIEKNTNYGLYLYGLKQNTIEIKNTPIRGHKYAGIYGNRAEITFDAKMLENVGQLANNGSHVYGGYGKYTFDGVELADAKSYGVATWYSDVAIKDSKFLRNGYTGFQTNHDKSFKAENSSFSENDNWGLLYHSNGTYYGLKDGKWAWLEAEPAKIVDCKIEKNANYGLYLNGLRDNVIEIKNTPIRGHKNAGIYANHAHITFDSKMLQGVRQLADNGSHIYGGYGKYKFDGITLSGAKSYGAATWYSDVSVKDSTFSDNGYTGFQSNRDKSFKAENSKFTNNGSWGHLCYSNGKYYGIKDGKWAWHDTTEPVEYKNCSISDNKRYGWYLWGLTDDRLSISDTTVANNGSTGVYFNSCNLALNPDTTSKWNVTNNGHGFGAVYSNLTVEDFEVTGHKNWGMYASYSNVALKNAKFNGNGHGMYWYDKYWEDSNYKLTVENCQFNNNTGHYGLLTYYGNTDIKNSTFNENKGDGLYTVYNKSVAVDGSEFKNNQRWGVVYHVNYPQTSTWAHKDRFKDNLQTLSNVKVDGNRQGVYVYNAMDDNFGSRDNFGLKNTDITNNTTYSLYLTHCKMVVDEQKADNWTLAGNGYGPYASNGDITFKNVVNDSKTHGFLGAYGKLTLDGVISTGSRYGFYQYRPSAAATIKNSRFNGRNDEWGWGLLSYGGSVNATNNVFNGFYNGAYTYTYGNEPQTPQHSVYNNTFANLKYWGYHLPNGSATVYNNIFAGPASTGGGANGYGVAQASGYLTHQHNLVHGFRSPFYRTSDPSEKTVLNNPRFVNPASGDFHLKSGSPAINSGLDMIAMVPYDMEGNRRPSYKVFEIGAYEYTKKAGSFRVLDWQEKK